MMKASATKTSHGKFKPVVRTPLATWGRRSQVLKGLFLTRGEATQAAQSHIDRVLAERAAWDAKVAHSAT